MSILNELEQEKRANVSHASKNDIDDLLAELGYRSPKREEAQGDSAAIADVPTVPERQAKRQTPPSRKFKEPAAKPPTFGNSSRRKQAPAKSVLGSKPDAADYLFEAEKPVSTIQEQPVLDIPLVERKPPRQQHPKLDNKFIRRLQEALDEDVEELELLTASPYLADGAQMTLTKAQRHRRVRYFLLGFFGFLLAVVGLLCCINAAISLLHGFTHNTEQKQDFSAYISPLVVMDIADFESADALSSDQLLTAAIWDFIMHGDFSKYTQTMDVVTVPAVDIEVYVTQLFGGGLSFAHQTLGIGDLRFYYNEDTKSYNIPTKPAFFSYSPEVEDMTKEGTVYTLTVSYLPETPNWQSDTDRAAEKTALFVVDTADGQNRICSVKNITVNE